MRSKYAECPAIKSLYPRPAALLAKPKHQLDARGCVFLYLQYRAATRNMALMKHMFLEFLYHRETALLDFVAKGAQVMSVIPFALPSPQPALVCSPLLPAVVD
ncbi:hypothetical protein BBO99_00008914 [Phytophthora kernoviae]|uniref:Uncharacterized protein n=2 Tax=Phytophthora kernoviae TaxID=325452 RepID=A0A3R7G5B8_9STRA|nr:hypothetical protein G195_010212 [Phytophthora kernoviae 00238/432]KAG2508705.1 hypothetical protein JM16_008741 [Phytophthora kernoviae]KAG2510861.1 hypothetical protein JM18_008535 [Phytophthora kernoviae]RLN37003.1 hypothetical protein BBI17_008933 [Phytophthora kernoviae]RLN74522.1 hypothetical protein BBO99_00008914 [Phytophthora kernoviae]